MEYQNKIQDKRLETLEEHFITINSEMGAIKADVKWLKWAVRFMIITQVGILISLVKLLIDKAF